MFSSLLLTVVVASLDKQVKHHAYTFRITFDAPLILYLNHMHERYEEFHNQDFWSN